MSRPLRMSYLVVTPLGGEYVTGWRLACGSVLHRQLLWGGSRDDAWVVGDPASGAEISRGGSMGEALRVYRAMVAAAGPAWPQLLQQARHRVRRTHLALTRRHDVAEWSRYQHRQMPYLGKSHHRSH